MIIPPLDGSWPHSNAGNGTLTDFVYNRSNVLNATGTATDALNALLTGAFPPLTVDRTVYISATGDDSAAGTIGAPWQTLDRAWNDRKLYGELLATYTIQCQGVGPFTMNAMVGSLAGENGFFRILGDPNVEETLATGTFDGDLSNYVVATLPGLGESDEWGGKSIKILTGDLAGARVRLATNTDSSITVQSHAAWDNLGVTAPGDTFEVRAPGTAIVMGAVDASTDTVPGSDGWVGGSVALFPRHIISNVKIISGTFYAVDSTVALVGVDSDAAISTNNSQIASGLLAGSSLVGASDATGWGLASNTAWFSAASQLAWYGVTIDGSGFSGGTAGVGDVVVMAGGRFNAVVGMTGLGKFEAYGTGYIQALSQILLDTNSVLSYFVVDQILNFGVTNGDCLRASSGASMLLDTITLPFGGAITGGTADSEGGGLGCNAKGGGRINWVGQAPTLTGGVLNQDLDAGNGPVANATLAADGDGEADLNTLAVIARITAAL